MTQAIGIPTAPTFAQSAAYARPEVIASYEHIEDLPYRLQGMDTTILYMSVSGDVWHLNGPGAGSEGVQLAQTLQGEQHLFFEQVVTESAYTFGSVIERVNYLARKINLRVLIGTPGMNKVNYLGAETHWWNGQDEQLGGWLCVYTRVTGWRFIRVWPMKTVDTAQKMDPVAYNNNQAQWDINWIAPVPYYSKPALQSKPWKANTSGPPDADGYYHGTLAVPNIGDLGTYVEYLLTDCAGDVWLQDNIDSRMVQVNDLFDTDGEVLIDTDPTHKTIVTENDPHDNEFYKLLRASGVLDYFLKGTVVEAAEAAWLRGYMRFSYPIPPNTVAHLRVKASNPNAQIVAQVSQRFKRSR